MCRLTCGDTCVFILPETRSNGECYHGGGFMSSKGEGVGMKFRESKIRYDFVALCFEYERVISMIFPTRIHESFIQRDGVAKEERLSGESCLIKRHVSI